MKLVWIILLIIILLVSLIAIPTLLSEHIENETDDNFFFGVSFGGNTINEAKILIDKVKGYTNFFIINSWDIVATENDTLLNEICQYVVDSEMHFMVFFDFISKQVYPWHQTWLDMADERFGDKFLGVYLYDEPGGKQIDIGHWKNNTYTESQLEKVSNYSDATELFLEDIATLNSTVDVKSRNLKMVTSDYALYWFDYLAGYDTLFVELGWNHSRIKHIALCRGAANVQNKEWGTILTWTYNQTPYLVNGEELLQDMIISYRSGAKYIVIFNYPHDQTYGILQEEHFDAMKIFWTMIHSNHQEIKGKIDASIAFVLPKDYGWGLRHPNDRIWFPKWGPDEYSSQIWNKMNTLINEHGLLLDIVYDDPRFNLKNDYERIFYWNSTTT